MSTTEATAVLEAVNVTKHFHVRDSVGSGATVHAVENVTVRLRPGRIVALVGESGSGKTTLARLLAQVYPVTSGDVRLNGKPVGGKRAGKDYFRQVQLIFQ